MAAIEIAIEIGSSNTTIFLSGSGVVLKEPSVIAFSGQKNAKNVRAIGAEAYNMLGRAPEKTIVISPVEQGIITDFESAAIMLGEFLAKVVPDKFLFRPKIRAILCVPCGLSIEEREVFSEVCSFVGIKTLNIVESIIAAAVGIDLPMSTSYGGIIVNIGGGVTDIAALSLSGIIAGCSVNVGGTMMDKALTSYVEAKHNLQIGLQTAEKIKMEIGSLFANDVAQMEVSGIDLRTRKPGSCVVCANDTLNAYTKYYKAVTDAIENVINSCPPEIASDIYKMGIFVTGGMAKIPGLEEFFKNKLKLPITIIEDAQYSVISGAGKLLGNDRLLNEILEQN